MELFDAQAERTPAKIAVRQGETSVTYQELLAQSQSVAAGLGARGLGAGTLVAIALDRKPELVAALLGTLRAGAAYVPLDRELPRERAAYIQEQSGAAAVLGADDLDAIVAGAPAFPTAAAVAEGGRAYVIYTSGSTGPPKGVQVGHRALSNLLLAMRELLPISGDDVFVSATMISFDIAALELFLPLVVGACVSIAPRDVAVDGFRLAHYLARQSARPRPRRAEPAAARLHSPPARRRRRRSGAERARPPGARGGPP